MVNEVLNWITSYVGRLENFTPIEFGLTIGVFALALVGLAILLWKIFRRFQFYNYRKSQLNGWQANGAKLFGELLMEQRVWSSESQIPQCNPATLTPTQ